MATPPIPVLISSRNRPLYLWASLDSLYRGTRLPCHFSLLDMASDDPLVPGVIDGFARRGMFAETICAPANDSAILWHVGWRLAATHQYLAYVETDVLVEDTEPCWLTRLVASMEARPRLAMLGSAIDQRDFVSLERARALQPDAPEGRLRALIKADSIERQQDPATADGALFQPHSPAGRLLLLRTAALRAIGQENDYGMHRKFVAAGYETAIAADVRHRHLSLLHIFDYPDYDYGGRDRYIASMHSA